VNVALDEAITNAIFYGCLEVPGGLRETDTGTDIFNQMVMDRLVNPLYNQKYIKVEMDLTPSRVIYTITDPGCGFNPPDLKNQEIEPTVLSRLHGRGLLLISCFMDEVAFNQQGNQISLTKRRA
jgi:anti-sigma regulatory factor (Ser/Thr protein kinase)